MDFREIWNSKKDWIEGIAKFNPLTLTMLSPLWQYYVWFKYYILTVAINLFSILILSHLAE